MTNRFLAFEIAGLGQAPDPDDALSSGRILAERCGAVISVDARPRITQRADGSDSYRVEIPATFT
jgi:hypothetical protein